MTEAVTVSDKATFNWKQETLKRTTADGGICHRVMLIQQAKSKLRRLAVRVKEPQQNKRDCCSEATFRRVHCGALTPDLLQSLHHQGLPRRPLVVSIPNTSNHPNDAELICRQTELEGKP